MIGSDRFALDPHGDAARQADVAGHARRRDADAADSRAAASAARSAAADAIIGKVPLAMSDGSGSWRLSQRRARQSTARCLSRPSPNPPNFYPLRSDDVQFRLADDRVRATGSLLKHPASGTKVTDVTIDHRLSTGDGEAILDVPGIRFGAGLQPEELTRLTEGVIALVNGGLSRAGPDRLERHRQGHLDRRIHGHRHGPRRALRPGHRHARDDPFHRFARPRDRARPDADRWQAINPGILVENGVIRYQLLPDQLVKVERGEWPFMGGRLILQETILNFARPTAKRLTFEVVGLDAQTFVASLGFKEIDATGIFDGVLPMIFDENGGRIVGGRLDARPGGGSLAYNGVVNKANLGMMGNIAFEALRDLRFKSMIVRLDGDLAGEFATRLTIDGVALGADRHAEDSSAALLRRIPLKLNVDHHRALPRPDRHRQGVPRPAPGDRATCCRVPLDEVPGIVTEVRRREEEQTQTQTPVEEKIDVPPPHPQPNPARDEP